MATLGAGASIVQSSLIDAARENGFRLTKSRIWITMTGKTAGEGPISFGVAINLPNAASLDNLMNADPQDSKADISRGQGVFVQVLGKFGLLVTAYPSQDQGLSQMFEISYGKNGWSVPEGRALLVWARNHDSSALTTGTIMEFTAEHFGVWLRD